MHRPHHVSPPYSEKNPGNLPHDRHFLAQIERDFGSYRDFTRSLNALLRDGRKGGWVYLVCTPEGRLRLVRTPPDVIPRGKVLFRFPVAPPPPPGHRPPPPPAIPWQAEQLYSSHIAGRPPYPLP